MWGRDESEGQRKSARREKTLRNSQTCTQLQRADQRQKSGKEMLSVSGLASKFSPRGRLIRRAHPPSSVQSESADIDKKPKCIRVQCDWVSPHSFFPRLSLPEARRAAAHMDLTFAFSKKALRIFFGAVDPDAGAESARFESFWNKSINQNVGFPTPSSPLSFNLIFKIG